VVAKRYQLGRVRRVTNVVIGGLLRLGIPAPQKTSYLLTTRGRRTGVQRVTPVNLVHLDGDRWLVSPYGGVGWVHNLRADPALGLRRGRRREPLVAEELDAELAGPILRHYVRQVPITAPFFDADANAPVQDFVAEAARHPVFRLKPPG
jgi:deazaflavin-dependent oxidoreductase (nitroreductase family)